MATHEQETEEMRIGDWLRGNAVTVIGWMVFVGITFGTYKTTANWIDVRVTKLESANLEQLHYQVDANKADIQAMKADGRASQQQIADIKAQIGVLGSKLDNMNETLTRLDKRLDREGK